MTKCALTPLLPSDPTASLLPKCALTPLLPLLLATSLLLAADASDRPTVVVVVGAAGMPEYGEQFADWAALWEDAADRANARAVVIGIGPAVDPTDRQRLETLLQREAKQSLHPLWLILLGHGTFDGQAAKFNLRGPDVSATELGQWLEPFERPLAIVNGASSSAPFINRLSGDNRVIVTATKSGHEQNYARFGGHIARAITDPAADLDKDDQTSLLEAFLYSSAKVAESYRQDAQLATETALIDDNGDGRGTPASWFRGVRPIRAARDGASLDGTRANQFHLLQSDRERNLSAEQRARRDELELAVIELRESKATFDDLDTYYAKLEPLLVELARTYKTE